MLIRCSNCNAEYEIADHFAGQQVRCVICGGVWIATAAVPIAKEAVVPASEPIHTAPPESEAASASVVVQNQESEVKSPESTDESVPETQPDSDVKQETESLDKLFDEDKTQPVAQLVIEEEPRAVFSFKRFLLAVSMILASVVALAGAAYFGRFYLVVKYGEPFKSWCRQLNINCDVPGTGLEIKDLSVKMFDGVLTVQGVVQNLTDKEQPIPPLVLALMDAKNNVLQSGYVENVPTTIQGLGKQQFSVTAEPDIGVENGIILFYDGK